MIAIEGQSRIKTLPGAPRRTTRIARASPSELSSGQSDRIAERTVPAVVTRA